MWAFKFDIKLLKKTDALLITGSRAPLSGSFQNEVFLFRLIFEKGLRKTQIKHRFEENQFKKRTLKWDMFFPDRNVSLTTISTQTKCFRQRKNADFWHDSILKYLFKRNFCNTTNVSSVHPTIMTMVCCCYFYHYRRKPSQN